MNEMENCYLLLGLDPEVTDPAKIEAAIKKKQIEWSRNRTHPSKELSRSAQQGMENLDKIRAIMLDPEQRAKAAREAKQKIAAAKDGQRQAFEDAVEMLSKGTPNEAAIKKIAQNFAAYYYTEEDVRETLTQFQRSSGGGGSASGQGLDASTARAIRESLNQLKLSSLYELLGLPQSASLAALKSRAGEMLSDLRAAKVDAEKSIKQELLGHCNTIFKDEAGRSQYNHTLESEKLAPLVDLINTSCDSGSVEIGHVLKLMSKAGQYQVTQQRLWEMIREVAARRKVALNVSESVIDGRSVVCVCGQSNPALNESCGKCRKPLYQKCPNCKKAITVDSLECTCGYSLRDTFNSLESLLNSGRDEEFVDAWKAEYNQYPAFHKLARAYSEIRQRVDQKRRSERELNSKIERLLAAIQKNDDVGILREWNEALLAKHPRIKPHLERIRNAHRPQNVRNVEAFYHGSYIQVSWDLPNNINRFLVVWSKNGYPASPQDGQSALVTRGEFERNGFRIKSPTPGSYYLTVFAISSFKGEELRSDGASKDCRALIANEPKVKVHYDLQFKGLFRKNRAVLSLRAEKTIPRLPELVLVAKRGTVLPSDAGSGQVVARLENVELLANQEYLCDVALNGIASPARFRLFLTREADQQRIELLAESLAKLKI